jgi:putative transposase
MPDGEHLNDCCVVVALAVGADGTKVPGRVVGRLDGEQTAVRSLRTDLAERGLNADNGLLVVIAGAKALTAGMREVFGAKALVQRCAGGEPRTNTSRRE